ncbi:polyglutamine-binding protein 1-like [Clavelina lepadiformis]|uniref:polyglutamine-binding protein 1-like n=1 Tax=Clavelina lepadiformis TaxID=159417 RepID=UPI0040429EFA
MPLPPALAARLAKRGIITQTKPTSLQDEEVIEENYDNPAEVENRDEFGNPLPLIWKKVWNDEYNTCYYWDTESGRVSWLPPDDPEAEIAYPASKLASGLERRNTQESDKAKSFSKMPRRRTTRSERIKEPEEFDPMDPSSYSDAPRGNWSVGLKKINDAKSGVDSTANGPLFQQRPYPSPGEVLNRNKQATQSYGPVQS